MMMAGANDILYDHTSDTVIAQKVTAKMKNIIAFLTLKEHKNFKVFILPTFLQICPNLFFMDFDGRDQLKAD